MIFLIKKILHNYFSCFLWAFICMFMDFGQPNGVALTKSPTGPQLIWVLKELLNFGKSFVRSKIGKMKALKIFIGPWELGPIVSYSICLLPFFSLAHVFFFFFNLKVGAHKEFYNFIYSSSHFYRSTLTVWLTLSNIFNGNILDCYGNK